MITFDSIQVQTYAAKVHAKLDECANGEGMICEGIDKKLVFFADQCWDFYVEVQRWANEIFSGRVAFDPTAEKFWIAELNRISDRAYKEWVKGAQAENDCFILDGRTKLSAALWYLTQLMNPWVTPSLSIGPGARRKLTVDTTSEEFKGRLASMRPHPKEWMPLDKDQIARYKSARG